MDRAVASIGVDVTDAPEQHRYEARNDGELAGFAEYRATDRLVTFVHTEVLPEFEGRGVGSGLVRAALDGVRASGRRVRALCPFVKGYIERHPGEYDDLAS
jgi:predicted GNAT family acetyltransferase